MSEIASLPNGANTLAQRLQNAEKSILFLQHEHASTLSSLHEEIAKWQQKCSDLTFQLAIGSPVINTADDNKLRATAEQLENKSRQCKEKIRSFNKLLKDKERTLNNYGNYLIDNDRKHTLELHVQHEKQRELNIEQQATLIAQLTGQIHREQHHQQNICNRVRLGGIILPNKPTNVKNNEQQQPLLSTRRVSKRSSSLSNHIGSNQELAKVLFIGRRPPTPPRQLSPRSIGSNDEHLYTKRQHQLLNNHTEKVNLNNVNSSRSTSKLSTILPPIINRKMPLKALATIALQPKEEA